MLIRRLTAVCHRQSYYSFRSLIHLFYLSILTALLLAGNISSTHAATLIVPAGGNLQATLNAAQPGDEIVLAAGASFIGPFSLPNKGPSALWITIRSSALDQLPAHGQRILPAHAPLLPKLLSPGQGAPALLTAAGAHHFRLLGLEFSTTDASSQVYDLIELGTASATQNSLEKVPHHLTLDRCLVTAFPTQSLKRGIALHSAETEITGCHIAGFKSTEQDAQAIGGWNGPGPFQISNNYLEASGENLLIGGSLPAIAGLIPSDIEIRGNYFNKPLSWRPSDPSYAGVRWSVKSLFELKSARRVTFEGNLLEHCWGDVNWGYGAINLTVRGDSGPQAVIEEVVIRHNIMRHTANGLNMLGKDEVQASGQGRRIRVENNLFEDIDKRWGGDGEFIKMRQMNEVVITHNTVLHNGNILLVYGEASSGLEFTNNIMAHNSYGIIGPNQASGISTLKVYLPRAIIKRNVITGANPADYPQDNFYPTKFTKVGFVNPAGGNYRLAGNSPYKGKATDGKDVGCDFDLLRSALMMNSNLQKLVGGN
jgi:hypothetical protein